MIFVFFDYLKRNKKTSFPSGRRGRRDPFEWLPCVLFFYYYYYWVVIIIIPQECADCVLFFFCFFLFGGGGAGEFVFRVVRALLFVTRMTMSKWIISNGFIFFGFSFLLFNWISNGMRCRLFCFDGHIRIVSVCVRGWLFSLELLIFWLYNDIVLLDHCKVEWRSSGWKWRLLWHVSYIGCPFFYLAPTWPGRVISRVLSISLMLLVF